MEGPGGSPEGDAPATRGGPGDAVAVADAPAIPGLAFRRFRGPGDYPAIVAVLQRCKSVDGTEGTVSLEEVSRNYEHLMNCDPYQDMLFAEIDGQVVAYSRALWFEELSGARLYLPLLRVMPDWRGLGLGEAMLRYLERRLREIAASHPPGVERFFHAMAEEGEVYWQAVLQGEGYRPVHYAFGMVRPDMQDIPDLPLPAGLEVRPVEPEHYPLIIAALNEAFRDNWSFVGFSEEWFANWQAAPSFDPSLWQVAWAGDQVAGTVLSYIEEKENQEYQRRRGYTEYICVRQPWRRRGLARALIARSLRLLRERGMAEAALGVDATNATGALRLYESLGFRRTNTLTTFRKPL